MIGVNVFVSISHNLSCSSCSSFSSSSIWELVLSLIRDDVSVSYVFFNVLKLCILSLYLLSILSNSCFIVLINLIYLKLLLSLPKPEHSRRPQVCCFGFSGSSTLFTVFADVSGGGGGGVVISFVFFLSEGANKVRFKGVLFLKLLV